MNQVHTYHAVFRKDQPFPWALFYVEQDAIEWHCNPALFVQGRRRVQFLLSPQPQRESLERALLRKICFGPDDGILACIAEAQKLLKGGV